MAVRSLRREENNLGRDVDRAHVLLLSKLSRHRLDRAVELTARSRFNIALSPTVFTVLMFTVGIAMAIGKASVFKFVSDEYTGNIGAVSGVVGLAGGLAGFALPILFGLLADLTGVSSTCFMLLFGATAVSLIWMHFSFRTHGAAALPRASV